MSTTTDTRTQPSPIPELLFDRTLLRDIFRQRLGLWALFGGIIFGTLLGSSLLLLPLTYTATVSLSIQQPAPTASGALAMLAGSTGKRYLGQMRSRKFAQEVEKTVHLQEILGLPNETAAEDALIGGLKVDDLMNDGLMYITVSLKGPSRFAPDPNHTRDRIREATAKAANGYAEALRRYLIYSDTDKEAVLLRTADNSLRRVQQRYRATTERLARFVSNQRVTGSSPLLSSPGSIGDSGKQNDNESETGSSGKSPSVGTTDTSLQALYRQRADLEIEMSSTDKGKTEIDRLLLMPMEDLLKLPPEDPLLADSRDRVNDAARRLQSLEIQLGDDNPRVVQSRARLAQEKAHLQDQINAILKGRTTSTIRRQQLETEYAKVLQLIAQAEHSVQNSRKVTFVYEQLRQEMMLSLEALKTVTAEDEKMKLQIPAGQNRMNVVDWATPPRFGVPGILIQTLTSIAGALIGIGLLLGFEYTQRSAKKTRAVVAL